MASVLSAPSENRVAVSATRLLINNRWIPSESGKTFATINPSTGEEICQIAEADAADVEKAVRAARAAFEHGAVAEDAGVGARASAQPARRSDRKPRRRTGARSNRWTTASRSRSRRRSTSRPRSAATVISPAGPTRSTARPFRSTAITSATRGTSRWAWWGRSFPGISRC